MKKTNYFMSTKDVPLYTWLIGAIGFCFMGFSFSITEDKQTAFMVLILSAVLIGICVYLIVDNIMILGIRKSRHHITLTAGITRSNSVEMDKDSFMFKMNCDSFMVQDDKHELYLPASYLLRVEIENFFSKSLKGCY